VLRSGGGARRCSRPRSTHFPEAIMYRRVAVALDTSPESRYALRWAMTIARRANCPLELVRVAVPDVYGTELYTKAVLSDAEVEQRQREAEQDLRNVADEAASEGVRATPVILEGEVPSTLADHLRDSDVDLAVMTTHDRGRLERLLLGSVSDAVMRHAHIPALLVRVPRTGAVANREPELRRMLLPFDGSPFAEQILAPAMTLATVMGADLTLLSVVEPILASAALAIGIDGTPSPGPVSRRAEDEADEERASAERQSLERTAERIRSMGIGVEIHALIDARPAHAIVDFAEHHAIDLIAMTTHGRGALKRLVAGSVAEGVLHAATSHMLLYRPEHPAPS
jgi:nucleotide-binding universal stress UspA family protein